MRSVFKKIFSLTLCLVMVFTVCQCAMVGASARIVKSDNKTRLTVTADKGKYSWGDKIIFSIEVKNITNEELTDIAISSFAEKYLKIVWLGDMPFIDSLKPGETETVQVRYIALKTVGPMAVFLPIVMLFHPLTVFSYKRADFNCEKTVRVGAGLYKVGFEVGYNKRVVDRISDYNPGDYTAAYKNFFADGSYTLSADINSDAITGLPLNDTHIVVFSEGTSRITHYTADVRKALSNVDKHRILGYYKFSKSPLFKDLGDVQAYIMNKKNKFYLFFPQVGAYTEAENNKDYEKINDLVSVIFTNGKFIESQTADEMIRESFRIDDELIYHYYYKDGKFFKLDAEKNGKSSNLLMVTSILEGVKNKAVFIGPYGVKI